MSIFYRAAAVKTTEEKLNDLLNQEVIPLRRTQCRKYYAGTEVEIWELSKGRFFMVWNYEGFYYGFEAYYICYAQLKDLRERMLGLSLDNTGIAF